jgi:hypothetical protein
MRPPKVAKPAKTSKNQRLENTPPKLQNQLVKFEQIRRPAANVYIYRAYTEFCWSENFDNESTHPVYNGF